MKPDSRAQAPTPSRSGPAGGAAILLVEDNPSNQKVFVHQLEALGHAAQVAMDGQQGLDLWRSGSFALILADCNMPVMDGYAMTQAIRREERERGVKRGIPIIAVTANVMPDSAERCKAAGMDAYLAKPVALADLEQALAKWLPRAAGPDAAATSRRAPQAGASAVDPAVMIRVFGEEDRPLIALTLQIFIKTSEADVQSLLQALIGGDRDAICRLAHKLKSSAQIIGAQDLGALYQRIEEQSMVGVLPPHAELGPRIREKFEQVRHYVDAYARQG